MAVAAFVQTKDASQCKNYYYNNRKKFGFSDGRRKKKRDRERSEGEARESSTEEKPAVSTPTNLRKTVRRSSEEQPAVEKADAPSHTLSTPPRSRSVLVSQALPWTDPEKNYFAQLLAVYGTDWISIKWHIKTKSDQQLTEYFEENKETLSALLPDFNRRKRGRRSSISNSGGDAKGTKSKKPRLSGSTDETSTTVEVKAEIKEDVTMDESTSETQGASFTFNSTFGSPEHVANDAAPSEVPDQEKTPQTETTITTTTTTMTTTVVTNNVTHSTNTIMKTSTTVAPNEDLAFLVAMQKRPSRRKSFGGSYSETADEDYSEEPKVPLPKGKKRPRPSETSPPTEKREKRARTGKGKRKSVDSGDSLPPTKSVDSAPPSEEASISKTPESGNTIVPTATSASSQSFPANVRYIPPPTTLRNVVMVCTIYSLD